MDEYLSEQVSLEANSHGLFFIHSKDLSHFFYVCYFMHIQSSMFTNKAGYIDDAISSLIGNEKESAEVH